MSSRLPIDGSPRPPPDTDQTAHRHHATPHRCRTGSDGSACQSAARTLAEVPCAASFAQRSPIHVTLLTGLRNAGFCNGPSCVNPFLSVILSPASCFCPGSARGRHLIGSDEDRSANLGTRSHLASCSRICGLTGSIVPATGPAPDVWCLSARTCDLFLSLYFGGRLAGDELGPIDHHPVQDHGELACQRHLRLAHASAPGYPHRPALQR
jgi:hypothetical protein